MKLSLVAQKIEYNLQKEILKLFGKEGDSPEKHTILGSDINEIRHIFYYLKSQRIPIRVYYLVDTYTGFISNVGDTIATIQIVGFEESYFRRMRISFNFLNIYYQFEVTIHEVIKDKIDFYLPLQIQYTSKRKYPRFFPKELYAHINILYQSLFSQKQYEQLFHQFYSIIIEELKNELPDLSLILRIVLSDLEKISQDFSIHFFPEKKARKLSWLEKQMLTVKNTIFIENTESLNSYYQPLPSSLLTNFERLYRNMLKTNSEEDVIKYFEKIQSDDIRKQKNSYIITPITLFAQIIGYIYIETSYVERKRIFIDDAIKIAIISRIISYTITRIAFYQNFYLEPRMLVRNISLSGVLLKFSSRTVYEFLIDHDAVKIEMNIRNQVLSFRALISRMFSPSEDEFNIALEFIDYLDDSFAYLENYIHELQTKT